MLKFGKMFLTIGLSTTLYLPAYASSPSEKEGNPGEGAKYETSFADGHFPCGFSQKTDKTRGSSFANSTKIWSKRWSAPAAKKALNAGYNYAIMAPYMVVSEGRFAATTNFWGTRTGTRGYNAYHRSLTCFAVDDIAAFEILSGGETKFEPGRHMALVDIRQFIATLKGENASAKPWSRNISSQRYKRPGDRERIDRLYPIQRKAAQCHTGLKPTSLRQFQYDASPQEKAQTQSCLEALRPEAARAGWTDFLPLGKAANPVTPSKGYSVNRPSATPSTGSDPWSLGPKANEQIWGSGWLDQSKSFPALSGVFLRNSSYAEDSSKSITMIFASNTRSESELLDHAVYYLAKQRLLEPEEGMRLQDLKPKFMKQYETIRARIDTRQQENRTRSQRDLQGSNDNDISSLQIELKYAEKKIARYQENINGASESERALKEYLASIPGQPPLPEGTFKLSASINPAKLAELTQDRDRLLAEIAAKQSGLSVSTSAVSPHIRVSDEASSDKAIYRAFEDYKTVIYMTGGKVSSECKRSYYVCADKLQAYNAVGPKINAPGHTQLSMPSEYETFDVTPID